MNEALAERMRSYLTLIATACVRLGSDLNAFRAHGTQKVEATTGPQDYSITDLVQKPDDIDGKLPMININTTS